MVLWAMAMAVVLFLHEAHWGSSIDVTWSGIGATVLFGIFLGWRRRTAAIFVAPLISWLFAWVPLWVAAMIRHGFIGGLATGFFWVTVGWVFIAFLEFLVLSVGAFLGRLLHPRGEGTLDEPVVIFGPDGRPH